MILCQTVPRPSSWCETSQLVWSTLRLSGHKSFLKLRIALVSINSSYSSFEYCMGYLLNLFMLDWQSLSWFTISFFRLIPAIELFCPSILSSSSWSRILWFWVLASCFSTWLTLHSDMDRRQRSCWWCPMTPCWLSSFVVDFLGSKDRGGSSPGSWCSCSVDGTWRSPSFRSWLGISCWRGVMLLSKEYSSSAFWGGTI